MKNYTVSKAASMNAKNEVRTEMTCKKRRGISGASWNRALRLVVLVVLTAMVGMIASGVADAAMSSRTGSFVKNTAAGAQSITGVGFQPKAVIFYWTKQTAAGYSANISGGYGFAAASTPSITMAALSVQTLDNSGASTDANVAHYSTASIVLEDTANGGALNNVGTVTAFGTDGFTVTWSAAGQADVIHYTALGGTDITNARVGTTSMFAAVGNSSVTGVGFQPEAVLLMAANRSVTTLNQVTTASRAGLNLGFMVGGVGPTQGSVGWGNRDAQAAATHGSTLNSAQAMTIIRGNTIDVNATYSAMGADGFTLNASSTGGATNVSWLALDGGMYKVGAITQRSGAGSQATTGLGLRPNGLLLFSTNSTSANGTIDTANPGASMAIGGGESSTAQGSIWFHNTGFNPNDANMAQLTTKAIRLAQSTATTLAEADITSVDSDGFTLNWTTADTTLRRLIYFAAGAPGDSTPPTIGTINVNPTSTTYTNTAPVITATMTDAESAVSSCQYTTDNGSIWNSGTVSGASSPYTCTGNAFGLTGAVTINVRGTSGGGTGTGTAVARTVDSAAPTTTATATGYTFGIWTATSPISVTLSAVDTGGAGVAASNPVYCTGSTDTCSPATVYSAAISVPCTAGTTCTTYVRYRATDNVNNTETVKSSQVRQDRTPPTDGATFTATPISPTQIDLSWALALDNDSGLHATTAYKLVRATGATAPADCTGAAVYTGLNSTFSDTGRTQSTQYSYRVCAYDVVNNVSAGRTVSATTPSASDVTPPTAGTVNVTPSAGTTPVFTSAAPTITATFTDAESAVTSCQYTTNGSTWVAGAVSGTSPTYTCTANPTGLTGALTINMRATSTGGTGTGTSVARTADSTVPAEGATFTVAAADARQINVSWTTATDAGAGLHATAPYKLVRAAGSTPPADCSGAAVYSGTATSYNDAGLPSGTTYSYRMCVYDAVNNASTGKTGTATTNPLLAVYPLDAWTNISTSAPNNISGTITTNTLTVSTADSRLFLAGVCLETAANATVTTMNVSLGGTALTQIAATSATSNRAHCYVGRLLHSVIPGTPAALQVQYALNTSTVTGIDIKWASFYGVNQTTPVNDSNASAVATTNVTFGAQIDYTLGGMTTYAATNGGSAATHAAPPSGFSTINTTASSGLSTFGVRTTTSHAAAGNYPGTTSVAFAGTTAAYSAVAVASMNRANCVEPATVAVTEPVPDPIITAYSLSATGTGGATGLEVSADNTNWFASPWIYTPPVGSTGSVTFYARATGACGSQITDATPVVTSYNTIQTYAITACDDCHGNPPLDGTRSPATRAVVGSHNAHVTGQSMACTDCHVNNTANGHMNLNIEMSVGATAIRGGYYDKNNNSAYNAGVDNIFALSDSPTLSTCRTTVCHIGPSPVWGTPAALGCNGCHGYPPDGTNGINHNNITNTNSASVSAGSAGTNHQECLGCHMTNDDGAGNHAPYASYTPATMHMNGQLEMNTTQGYNQTTFGCTASCHGDSANYRLSDSGKTINLISGPAGASSCDGCHGNPPNTGAHQKHVVLPRGNTDAQDRTDCAICHPGADTYTYSAGGNHNTGTVNVSGTGITYSVGAVVKPTANWWLDDTCSMTVCHSTGTATWGTPSSVGCTACHGNPPTSAKHSNHLTGTVVVCGDCHTVPTDNTHITDKTGATTAAVITGMAQALADEAEVTTTTWNDTNNTCANTACHAPSGGAYIADWDTGPAAACNLCHSQTDPATGSHTAHMSSGTLFGRASTCNDCHPAVASNKHMTRALDYTAGMNYTASRCTTTTCHNDGTGTYTVAVQTPVWGTASGNCTICHAGTPPTGAHTIHVNAPYAAACSSCHTAETATTHINSTRNMAASVTYTAASGTCNSVAGCHNNTGLADWRDNVPTVACVDCHAATYVAGTGPTGLQTSGVHTAASAGVTHHDEALTAGCGACHVTTYAAAHRNGALNSGLTLVDRANMTYAVNGAASANLNTCSGTGLTLAAGCHTDNGNWQRLWSTAADSTATTSGSARCGVCHGEYGSWRTGTIHALEPTKGSTGHASSCNVCHSYGHANYTMATYHENTAALSVTMNSNNSTVTRNGLTAGKTICLQCHNTTAYELTSSTTFTAALTTVLGDPITGSGTCLSCHGGTYPPATNAHTKHATNLNVAEGLTNGNSGDDASLWNSTRHPICAVCHDMSVSGNHTDTAEHILPAAARAYAPTPTPAYQGNFTCSNMNCHFGTSAAWK